MTIAQQLKIKEFPFEIKDPNGNEIYFENSASYWAKREYDDGNLIFYENFDGVWVKREYDDGNEIYYENSYGYWIKREYDDGNLIYFENSEGRIIDKRPKTDVQKAIDLLTKEGLLVDGQILKRTLV